jgi:hypothetical protein
LRSKDKESRERCQAIGREVRIVHHREGEYPQPALDFFLGNLHNNDAIIFGYIVYSIAERDLVC